MTHEPFAITRPPSPTAAVGPQSDIGRDDPGCTIDDSRSLQPAPRTRLDVCVRDLTVGADIGIYPHEIGVSQPLIIDIQVQVEVPEQDCLECSIDYDRLADHARRLATQRINLIETFAHRLALTCLREPGARAVEVQVRKPTAIPGAVASVCVRAEH